MSVQKNIFANMPAPTKITMSAAQFVETVKFEDLSDEALHIAKRCIIDSLGLYLAGGQEETIALLIEEALDQGGREDALLLGSEKKVPAALAARVLGTAGHAHDWDDSQVSQDPAHIYGLLTHPSIPPLTASLVMAQKVAPVSGKSFMLAFQTGFEVECKISEWMLPQHYMRGMHSSGTVGTFGAFAASAKLLGLKGDKLRHGFGIAASLAAGIRCNFGTMTKPLHVGRASENGVTAALLAARGFTADPDALDGPWGFMAVHGGGADAAKLDQGFGQTWTINDPGVSIKPYPCGILTHPTIDLMLKMVLKHDIQADEIAKITVHAGSNILNPIRYPVAKNHLQAKFSLPAALAMIALVRKAGKIEFSDAFVAQDEMQRMQQKITTKLDPEIEALGFDKMRSRITIEKTDGTIYEDKADERYRGGPENPMTDGEVEAKFRSCADGVISEDAQRALLQDAWNILELEDAGAVLARHLTP